MSLRSRPHLDEEQAPRNANDARNRCPRSFSTGVEDKQATHILTHLTCRHQTRAVFDTHEVYDEHALFTSSCAVMIILFRR